MRTLHGVRLLPGLLAAMLVGCSSPHAPDEDDIAGMRLARLGLWYGQFASQNRGKPPKTIEQLQQFGQERTNPEQLAALQAADVAALFVSPRDGEPYKMVNYDRLPAPTGDPVVVFYEQKGRDGTRRVALLGGGTLAVNEQRLAELVPAFKPSAAKQ